MSVPALEILPIVEEEIWDEATYYEDEAALGVAFLAEIDRAFTRIVLNPLGFQHYAHVPEALGVRQVVLDRFPTSVFFQVVDDQSVLVVAVSDQRRRPGHWIGRLRAGPE